MKKLILLILICLVSGTSFSQPIKEWKDLRPGNTGVCGIEHLTIAEDKSGNIWSCGHVPFYNDGSVFHFKDTIFTCWSNFEGYIPSYNISKIAFDNFGIVWIGSDSGLTRFNGSTWQTFSFSSMPGFVTDGIKGIAFDASNNMWFTTQPLFSTLTGMLGKFDGVNWTFYTTANSNLPAGYLNSVAVDSGNIIWIGATSGLIKFDGTSFSLFTSTNSSLTDNAIQDISIDAGIIYIANGISNIDLFNGTSFSHLNTTNNNWPVGMPLGLIYARNGKIIAAEKGISTKVAIYNGVSWQVINTPSCYGVLIDSSNDFWISNLDYIGKYNGSQWTYYTQSNTGLGDYFTNSLMIDSLNNKWFVNSQTGVQVFNCPKWESYNNSNQNFYLPSPSPLSTIAKSVVQDSYGDIWLAYHSTDGAIYKIPSGDYSNYGSWVVYNLANTFPSAPFQFFDRAAADDAGRVWFMNNTAAFLFDHATNAWSYFNYSNSTINATYLTCMAPAPGGIMWFATLNQLFKYDNGAWSTVQNTSLGLPVNASIFDIEYDHNGRMWMASDSGLFMYDGLTTTLYNSANSGIIGEWVTDIEIGNNDTIFIAGGSTFPQVTGISIYNGSVWSSFAFGSSPLSSSIIDDIELDKLGNLWITGGEGATIYKNGGLIGFDCIDNSIVTSINNVILNSEKSFFAFPNPASDKIFLSKIMDIKIYDALGSIVFFGKNITSVNTTNLADGLYVIKTRDNETQKIIIKK